MWKKIKKLFCAPKPRFKLIPVSNLKIGMRVWIAYYQKPSIVKTVDTKNPEYVSLVFKTWYQTSYNGILITGYHKNEKLWVEIK